MALTKISSNEIQPAAITADLISADVSLGVKISNVSIANSSYNILDDTAVSTSGGYIVITGAGFNSGAQVVIDNTTATSVTRISSTELRAQVPAKSAATYNVYVINTDGSTGIRVNGLTYSGTPTWVTGSTLDNQAVDVAFNVAFNATGATSYTNTSALPAGTSLLSNGYFYGTVTGIAEETTYSFTVVATDAENQDSPRTFSVTVTVAPPAYLYAWGYNPYGELGLNDITAYRSSPTQVGSDSNWQFVDMGGYTSFGIKNDGTLWSWGRNNYGRLGVEDTINRSSPVQVGSSTNWSKTSHSLYHVIALKTNGTLWSWGVAGSGQLGLNTTAQVSSPTQVGTDTWIDIATGSNSSVFIKNDGTMWSCGQNGFGILGIGNINDNALARSSPVQIGSDTNWSKVSSRNNNAMAIKTNNTMYGWGYNFWGELGINTNYKVGEPTQTSGTSWSSVDVGEYVTLAIKTDGTLWSIGKNSSGQLGLGNTIARSNPVQIGTGTDWSKISSGNDSSFAIKTDGTLWAWGRNTYGMLGLNTVIDKSSPVQVGSSTSWNLVSYDNYSTLAC